MLAAQASIAIVDDDPEIRDLLACRFRMFLGIHIAGQAENGREAIALAGRVAPDLMILDLNMPVMGGADAIPLVRAVAPDIRIVVHSAQLADADLSGPRRPDACVIKDGNLRHLVSVVTTLLAEVRADRQGLPIQKTAESGG